MFNPTKYTDRLFGDDGLDGRLRNIGVYRKLRSFDLEFYIREWYVYAEKLYDKFIYNKYFGFSENNPGMPSMYRDPRISFEKMEYMLDAPKHVTASYKEIQAWSWKEVFFGRKKPMNRIEFKKIENTQQGYYGFEFMNYRNLYYLPDWVSAFIQLQLHVNTYDVAYNVHIATYDFLIFWGAMWNIRMLMTFYLYINIYEPPFSYFASSLDWVEDLFGGMAPTVLGVNTFGIIVLLILGRITDAMNHVIYTMPYLPSEGEYHDRALPNVEDTYLAMYVPPKEMIVMYHYFPALWFAYGIPDEIRVEWFQKDIIKMEYYYKLYAEVLGIQVLPNYILDEFPEWKDTKNVNWDIISQIVLLPERTIESLHTKFDKLESIPIPDPVSVPDSIPISIISESLNLHFSFTSLVHPDLIVLKTKLIQESELNFNVGFVQQYYEFFWNKYIDHFF